jgi:hypothetical protein
MLLDSIGTVKFDKAPVFDVRNKQNRLINKTITSPDKTKANTIKSIIQITGLTVAGFISRNKFSQRSYVNSICDFLL